ncbi:MAG: phosphoserine phosphatase SerB [Mariprofundaceae bacterium]
MQLFAEVAARQLHDWQFDAELEVWASKQAAPRMRAHIYHCADFEAFKEICASLALEQIGIVELKAGGEHTTLTLSGDMPATRLTRRLRPLAERLDVDIAVTGLPPTPSLAAPGILFMDMDSTLIQCECIDEIADFLGIKEKISSITQRAMEGDLDFTASLVERVKLLAGLDADTLQRVYDERIRLMDGAETLVETLHAHGWKVGLVSGGFRFFTDRLRDRLNLDFTLSNTLERIGGKLTGHVIGNIVDAEAKRQALIKQAVAWNIPMTKTVAIGDGANDLPMLETASLGIAFHAKPKVRELAPYALSHGGLDRALDLLGG